jgi:hypothetical protein
MVDPDPGAYRPRRAFLEPDRSDDDSVTPDVNGSSASAEPAVNGSRARRGGSRAMPEPAESPESEFAPELPQSGEPGKRQPPEVATPDSFSQPRSTTIANSGSDWAAARRSIFADLEDDEAPLPLYREPSPAPLTVDETDDGSPAPETFDETNREPSRAPLTFDETKTGTTESRKPDADDAETDTGRQTWVRPALASAPRRQRSADPEATTILARTSSAPGRGWQDPIDDFPDIGDGGSRLGKRTKLALLIAGVAAVVVVGLAIGWAVLGIGDTPTPPNPPSAAPTTGQSGTAELLNDDSMLNANDAKKVSSDRTWKVAQTQHSTSADSAKPACMGGDPAADQPASVQTIVRLLSANGKQPPGILHEADAFNTADDAGQAFHVAAKTLGGCAEEGGYVQSGSSVTGLGDQALGLVVVIERNGKIYHHSVVLNRTGRVTNVVDVVWTGDPVDISKVASALARATAAQCGKAEGACPGKLSVKAAPPPIGGDQPGFLAAGDLPPVGQTSSLWVGDVPDVPRADFVGAQCENVTWSTTPATARTARTYLLEQGADAGFGLDEIILTMKNDKAAKKFVSDLRSTVEKCPKRKLTASVPSAKSVSGSGAKGTKIDGWAVTVTQKVSNGSLKYRLGAVAAGPKVVYTFLSPKGKFDLSDDEWRTVAVRAGQRATQVN